MRTVSEIRTVEKRLRSTADQMLKLKDLSASIGGYTESRFQRAWSCLQEAADCMSYVTGNVESYMPAEEREKAVQAVLASMAGIES